MSKQATPPPPGDKSKPTAPPPPPTWRNWLWPIMIFAIFALWLFLPTRSASTSLSYSQFLSDVYGAPGAGSTPNLTPAGAILHGHKSLSGEVKPDQSRPVGVR